MLVTPPFESSAWASGHGLRHGADIGSEGNVHHVVGECLAQVVAAAVLGCHAGHTSFRVVGLGFGSRVAPRGRYRLRGERAPCSRRVPCAGRRCCCSWLPCWSHLLSSRRLGLRVTGCATGPISAPRGTCTM